MGKDSACAAVSMQVNASMQPQDPNYLSCLPEPLKSIALAVIPSDNNTTTNGAVAVAVPLPPAAARADRLEIALRQHLFALVQTTLQDTTTLPAVGAFWRVSLELCWHLVYFSETKRNDVPDERYQGMNVRKLPLNLLEDALDTLPVPQCRELWESAVEPAYDILFSQTLWTPSPTSHPCWLPFIKLTNKFIRRLSGEHAARIMLTTAKVFPIQEKSAIKVWGSYHADAVTEFETEQEFQEQQTTNGGAALERDNDDDDDDGAVPDYTFYESFWSLQHDFSNPSKISVADFLQRVRSLVQGLESHGVLQPSSAASDTTVNATTTTTTAPRQPTKYLTSSRLLHVQLSDPDFRIHVLTQFLIAAHHLQSEIPVFGTKLADFLQRAKGLMRQIQPNGAQHLKLLEYVLESSEKQWRTWKKHRCQPDIDKPVSEPAPVVADDVDDDVDTMDPDNNNENSNPRKRRINGSLLGTDTNDDEEEEAYQLIVMKTELPAISQKMRKVVPALETHFDEFVEALDPDSGIEAEYHPKNDTLFCWRALRLLSVDHLGAYAKVRPTGDLEPAIRQIYKEEKGVDIPGECPEDPPPEKDEEAVDDPPTDSEEGANATKDIAMVDTAAGSDQDEHPDSQKMLVEASSPESQDDEPISVQVVQEEETKDEGEVEETTVKEHDVKDKGAPAENGTAAAQDQNGHARAGSEPKDPVEKPESVAKDKVMEKDASKSQDAAPTESQPRRSNSRSRRDGPRGKEQRGGGHHNYSNGGRSEPAGDRRQNGGPGDGPGRDGRRHGPDEQGRDRAGSRPGPGGRPGHDGPAGGRGGGGPRGDRRDDRWEGDRSISRLGGGSTPPVEGDRRDDRREPDRPAGGRRGPPMEERRGDWRGGDRRRGGRR